LWRPGWWGKVNIRKIGLWDRDKGPPTTKGGGVEGRNRYGWSNLAKEDMNLQELSPYLREETPLYVALLGEALTRVRASVKAGGRLRDRKADGGGSIRLRDLRRAEEGESASPKMDRKGKVQRGSGEEKLR